jgi:hypothetical protein
MRRLRVLLLVAGFAIFGVHAAGVAQQTVFKTSVDLVRIDALVTIGGKPVGGPRC